MDLITQTLEENIVPLTLLSALGRQSLRQVIESEEFIQLGTIKQIWYKIQQTACNPSVTDKHLTAACNALCVFLQCTSSSKNSEVRSFAYSREAWASAYDVVHEAFRKGKTKPALQTVEVLLKLLKDNPDTSQASSILRSSIGQLLDFVFAGQPKNRLKEACIILSSFLRKSAHLTSFSGFLDIVGAVDRQSFVQRCRTHHIKPDNFDVHQEQPLAMLFLALLFTIQMTEPRAAALKLFSYLCSEDAGQNYSANVAVASRVIQIYFNVNAESLGDVSTLLFPALMTIPDQFELFLNNHRPNESSIDHDLTIYLAVLQVGREKSFVTETKLPVILQNDLVQRKQDMTSASTYQGFDLLLRSIWPSIRLQAYRLLTTSISSTQPVPHETLLCVLRNIAFLHNESDPYYRDEFAGISRRLFRRLEGSAHVHHKSLATRPAEDGINSGMPEGYESFLSQYSRFIISELDPQASYPRHILALQILSQLLNLRIATDLGIEWRTTIQLSSRPLFNLALDPFEDVRAMSIFLLKHLGQIYFPALLDEMHHLQILQFVEDFAARSNRGDQSDAVGRLKYLYHSLLLAQSPSLSFKDRQKQSKSFFSDMVDRICNYLSIQPTLDPTSSVPLHGTLLAVAFLIPEQQDIDVTLIEKLYHLCHLVWQLVQSELCVDSPERALEVEDPDDTTGPKDLLAYSWRALRDSSLIVQAIVQQFTADIAMRCCEQFGSLCLEQLIRLRHRGAFSTVARSFALCVQQARVLEESTDGAGKLLNNWETAAFSELERQASQLTRRSAGLPAIFCGLLDSNDKAQFKAIIDQLMGIASRRPDDPFNIDEFQKVLRLPQVHALNCLKDIMMNSKFRSATEALVIEMLHLAVKTIDSDIWAIRNCGLMLLRSCINRMVPESLVPIFDGTEGDQSSDTNSSLSLAIGLLSKSSANQRRRGDIDIGRISETVFAALDLLSRVTTLPHIQDIVNDHYESQFGNHLWAVREHAAYLRALNTRVGEESDTVGQLMNSNDTKRSFNELHSRILCVRLIVQRLWSQQGVADEDRIKKGVFDILNLISEQVLVSGQSDIVLSVYFDIINDAYSANNHTQSICARLNQFSARAISIAMKSNDNLQYSPLLHRAILLNSYQYWSLTSSEDSPMSILYEKSPQVPLIDHLKWPLDDLDAIHYVLDKIENIPTLSSRALHLFMELLEQVSREDTRARVMSALSRQLKAKTIPLTPSEFQTLVNNIKFDLSVSRCLFDSEISFATSLLVISSSQSVEQDLGKFCQTLLDSIQESLLDEIELPSRLNAALALCRLLEDGNHQVIEERRLQGLLMMYDVLNDDEEEIRHVAATYCSLVSTSAQSSKIKVAPCALAAREDLRHFIDTAFDHHPIISAFALCKVVGAKPSLAAGITTNLILYCRRYPVQVQIEHVIKVADDLFAEEKQNLYLDAVSEVSAWSTYADVSKLSRADQSVIDELCRWTNSGLYCLVSLLGNDSEVTKRVNFGSVSPTYHEDILLITIRVATMARLLLQMQSLDWDDHNVSKSIDVRHFQKLRDVCTKINAHRLIIEAFGAATG